MCAYCESIQMTQLMRCILLIDALGWIYVLHIMNYNIDQNDACVLFEPFSWWEWWFVFNESHCECWLVHANRIECDYWFKLNISNVFASVWQHVWFVQTNSWSIWHNNKSSCIFVFNAFAILFDACCDDIWNIAYIFSNCWSRLSDALFTIINLIELTCTCYESEWMQHTEAFILSIHLIDNWFRCHTLHVIGELYLQCT